MRAAALIIGAASASRQVIADKVTATGLFETILYRTEREEAFDILKSHPVQVIFQSIEEAEEARLGWLQSIRKLEAFSDLPLIAFVQEGNQSSRIHVLENGACDCLSFGASAEELTARIRIHLRHQDHLSHLRQLKKDLARLALTDALTGLYNRAFFDAALDSEITRCKHTGNPVSLMLIDLDHFKKINDHYGHQAGDEVLRKIADSITEVLHKEDVACRYGGEEFVVLLPGTHAPQAYQVASRLHRQVAQGLAADLPFHPVPTLSIGISCAAAGTSLPPEEFIEQADCALYIAKRNGRNRTEIFSLAASRMALQQTFMQGQSACLTC